MIDDDRYSIFQSTITEHLGFIIGDYEFEKVVKSPNCVAFEKLPILVQFSYGGPSWEIYCRISHSAVESGQTFSLDEIIDVSDQPKQFAERGLYSATNPNDISGCVFQTGLVLKVHAHDLLRGSLPHFQKLFEHSATNSDSLTKHHAYHWVRKKAELAWQKKDFKQLIELYGSFEKDLEEKEVRRLNYARSKV